MRNDPFGKPKKRAPARPCERCQKLYEPRTFQKRPRFCSKKCETRAKAERSARRAAREGEREREVS